MAQPWLDADALRPGHRLPNDDGSWAVVEEVVIRPEPLQAFNLTVAKTETYLVAGALDADAVWVHNCDYSTSRPVNLSPEGASRRGAFRAAKRNNGIPVSSQPDFVRDAVDNQGRKTGKKEYGFYERNANGKIVVDEHGNKKVKTIRDDTPHKYDDDPTHDRGDHFNDEDGNHYDY